MSLIRAADSDFRVCRVSFYILLEIQVEAEGEAERLGGLRWTHSAARSRKETSSCSR